MNASSSEASGGESPCVLILGASGVLGSALIKAFSEKSYRALGTGFCHKPSTSPALQFDASQAFEMPKLEQWIDKHTSHLDAVIHCIGINSDNLIPRMSDAEWHRSIEVNLKSAYLISNLLLPRFVKQRSGHFIFISSRVGLAGRAGQANYAAAKAALIGFTRSIAREYASRGIVANCVVPGVFQSPMTEKLSHEALERLWDGAAIKQFADINETAKWIVHLVEMRGATGQIFQFDGRFV